MDVRLAPPCSVSLGLFAQYLLDPTEVECHQDDVVVCNGRLLYCVHTTVLHDR